MTVACVGGSSRPGGRQDFRLLEHQFGRPFLFIRRVAILSQDAFHQHAQLRPNVFSHCLSLHRARTPPFHCREISRSSPGAGLDEQMVSN